jgi:hypothetical protein
MPFTSTAVMMATIITAGRLTKEPVGPNQAAKSFQGALWLNLIGADCNSLGKTMPTLAMTAWK